MGKEFKSEGIPFTQVGNRQCLTGQQLAKHPELRAFVGRFPNCFERDPDMDVVWFYPDGTKPKEQE